MEINHSKIKETNRKKIIALLLKKTEITKLDISKKLNISITTVSTNINELMEEGLVKEVRSLKSTGGRKAITYKIDENSRYSMGIALTANHIKISLVNLKREVVDNIKIRHKNEGIEKIIEKIEENVEKVLYDNNVDIINLLGIGVSIPSTVDYETGTIKNCYFLKVKNFNIKERLKKFNVPVYVDNEANLSAYYEFLNKENKSDSLLYVSITEGLGLGIIINGKVYRGDNNSSGEMGHMKIVMDGKPCKCGGRGCLEAYTSMNTLLDEYNNVANSNLIDMDEFEEKYEKRDENAVRILNDYLKTLSMGISNLIMILDPNRIIIGGDINNLLRENIDFILENIYKNNLFTDKNNCMIQIADYKESYLLGAAMVPIQEFLEIK